MNLKELETLLHKNAHEIFGKEKVAKYLDIFHFEHILIVRINDLSFAFY